MSQDPNQLFITQDGSSSLISGKFGEAYHSRHGALQESNHVFIDAGLKHLIEHGKQKINILEIGFGSGLNALLTLTLSTLNPKVKIYYEGLEAYPITETDVKALNYHELLGIKQKEFNRLHESEWNKPNMISDCFTFKKNNSKFELFESDQTFDLIYFDAFAPSIQSHLWETPFLKKIFDLCNQGAILVTYCAKGSFKRALKECGFNIEALPGPAKKREMTRAMKI